MSIVTDNERIRKLLLSYPVGAMKLLYDEFHDSLLNISVYFTKDKEASKDIVQDTFYLVWKNREELGKHHERSIEHYLVRVVKYKSISYYKKTRQLNIDKLKFIQDQSDSRGIVAPFEFELLENQILTQIRNFVSTLPKRQKECFLMQADQGRTVEQIGHALGITPKAVEKNLTRAKKAIRKHLKRG
ncbi:MAG TPA: sigma-70 family RNA polymerase sigma factor [Ohtaekwangia sp.]|uniref:RNA polymerase sigma factor n=1 Tax=Ohtaekwangia sp. TaxID=2066019 RepID=UPI002F92D97E